MIRNWLCNLLGCSKEVMLAPPSELEDIDKTELTTILRAEFPNASIYFSDSKYKTTNKNEYVRFILSDVTDKWQYVPSYFDCDDFSFSMMGRMSNPNWGCLAFGILWTKTSKENHAVNCFIDSNREVWILEPQTDKVFKLPKDWNPYLVMM